MVKANNWKETTMEYYKIVRWRDGRLYSAYIGYKATKPLQVEYVPGQPSKPSVGYLFLFEKLQDAKSYVLRAGYGYRLEIWTATAKGLHTVEEVLPGRHIPFACYAPSTMRRIWDQPGTLKRDKLQYIPYGTILAESVTLQQKIWPTF
jgi:hypothetical protein